jgi:hypothetical protein
MLKLVLAIAMVAAATAFSAPGAVTARSRGASATKVSMSIENMIGACPPAGFWDPLGLSADTSALYRRRQTEIKHGRVSMLATLGILVQVRALRCFSSYYAPTAATL